MDAARRRLGRIKRWLDLAYPGKYRVVLWVGAPMPKEFAECLGAYQPPLRRSEPAWIRIYKGSPPTERFATLIHEWAHYRTDPDAAAGEKHHGGHTNEFYLEQGRIERALVRAVEHELRERRRK